MTEYQLPPRFYDDHVDRDLPAGTVVRRTTSYLVVELDDVEAAELLSDARHYAVAMGEGGYDEQGVIASARATVRRLEAAGVRPAAPTRGNGPVDEEAMRADHQSGKHDYRMRADCPQCAPFIEAGF